MAPTQDFTSLPILATVPAMDCPHTGDTGYSATTGISLASISYAPVDGNGNVIYIRAINLTAGSGDISFNMSGGGTMTLPFTVTAGDSKEVLRSYLITQINKTGTTFSGSIFPVF